MLLARPMRVLRRLLPVVGLAAPIAAAAAHPRLEKSAPAAESLVAAPPKQISLTFNESLDLALTRVTLQRGTESVRLDSLRLVAGDDKTVTAAIPTALAPGRYTVKWQVTGDDGHPVRGEFAFEVLAAGTAPAPGVTPAKSAAPARPRA